MERQHRIVDRIAADNRLNAFFKAAHAGMRIGNSDFSALVENQFKVNEADKNSPLGVLGVDQRRYRREILLMRKANVNALVPPGAFSQRKSAT